MRIKDKMVEDRIRKLEKDTEYMVEHINLLQKRFDNLQDQEVRLAVEMDALVKGVKFITEAAEALINERNKGVPKLPDSPREQHYQ